MTTFGNPFWDKPSRPVIKEKFWETPKFWTWLSILGVLSIIAAVNGVFWQSVLLVVCLVIATGKFTITEMYELESVDDPFTH